MLTLQNTEAIRRIEEAIGYTFHDKRLLVQVLTRKTYLKIDPEAPDNEVLEFYGDTLMNYHVTNYFMSKYAHMLDDGLFFMRTVEQFTDMRSHYVCNRYLTDRVKALGLARYLRAQHKDSELRKDGEKAYADIFESLVGAIYLDSYQNDALIRAFILRQLGIEPKRPPEEIEAFDYDSLRVSATAEASEVALEEPESAADVPAVQTDKPEGEDTPASDEPIQEAPAPVEVEEALLKPAETAPQAVAEVPPVPEKAETVPASVAPKEETPAPVATLPVEAPVTAVTVIRPKQEALADFCRQWGLDQPTYGQTPPNAPNARPVAACTMKYKDTKGKFVKISLNDSGRTLAEATEKAAAKMLKKLERQLADRLGEGQNDSAKPTETVAENPEKLSAEATAEPVKELIPEAEVAEAIDTPVEEPASAEMHTVEETVAEAVETVQPAEETTATEEVEAPAVDTAEEVSAEIIAEDPVETLVEAPVESPAEIAEEAPVLSDMPVAEAEPQAEEPVEQAVSEELPEETADVQTEPEENFVQQTMILNVVTVAPETAEVAEVKPVKSPRKKKTDAEGDKPAKKPAARKKSSPKAEKPAEDMIVGDLPAEEAEASAKESKPRTRKPRAKKKTEASDTETSSEAVTKAKAEIEE